MRGTDERQLRLLNSCLSNVDVGEQIWVLVVRQSQLRGDRNSGENISGPLGFDLGG
jgi:hypothetical protein